MLLCVYYYYCYYFILFWLWSVVMFRLPVTFTNRSLPRSKLKRELLYGTYDTHHKVQITTPFNLTFNVSRSEEVKVKSKKTSIIIFVFLCLVEEKMKKKISQKLTLKYKIFFSFTFHPI